MTKRQKRSKFEEDIADWLEPAGFEYEPHRIPYVVEKDYIPDFFIGVNDGYESSEILVEAKGWFRPGDRQKYKSVRDSLNEYQELVFVLYSPDKKVQKGAKLTMAGWCEKEGLKWYSLRNLEELINYAGQEIERAD